MILQMDPEIGAARVFLFTPSEKCGEAWLANSECHHLTHTAENDLICTVVHYWKKKLDTIWNLLAYFATFKGGVFAATFPVIPPQPFA